MVTLLIGMALAFILGAVTVIATMAVTNPNTIKRTQQQAHPVTSKPVADKEREKTSEELKMEEYLSEMANMIAFDGRSQVKAE